MHDNSEALDSAFGIGAELMPTDEAGRICDVRW